MKHLPQLRLSNQWLNQAKGESAADVVKHMGAMQAQNYNMAKWAIACRMKTETTNNAIEAAFNRNEVLRTHVLRPTWHFVHPDDIRWMLALTGERLKKSLLGYWKKTGLSQNDLLKAKQIIEKKLSNRSFSSRDQLKAHFEALGKPAVSRNMTLLLMETEFEGLICSAGRIGNQFAYGLIDEIVPKTPVKSRDEALVALAHRYFTAHGPATVNDFSWWSGLTLNDCRKAIALAEKQLNSEIFGEQTFWHTGSASVINAAEGSPLLTLAAFDELLVGYRDRSALLPVQHTKKVITNNGLFNPTIVSKAKVVGIWQSQPKTNVLTYDTSIFDDAKPPSSQNLKRALLSYARFLELKEVSSK
jgi:hypothetical protein